MRGAALSDVHLDFSAFGRVDANGTNVRTVDVADAWLSAIEAIIETDPNILTIAGDVFHSPRPGVASIDVFLAGLRRLADAGIRVFIDLGNHDVPRSVGMSPAALARRIDSVHVAEGPTVWPRFPGVDAEAVSITMLPFVALKERAAYELKPDPKADVNVLVVHAAVASEYAKWPPWYGGGDALDVGELAEEWDVIHCGDCHAFTRLHPDRLAFYSGATERTTTNVWQEDGPFGFVTYDTDDQSSLTHHAVPVRSMRSYRFEGEGVSAGEVNDLLTGWWEDTDLDGWMLRLKIEGLPPEDREEIDWELVNLIRRKALAFQIEVEVAQVESTDDLDVRRITILEAAERFFEDDSKPVRRIVTAALADD